MIKGIGVNIDTRRVSGSLRKLEAELQFFNDVGFEYVEIPPAGLDVIIKGKLVPSRVERVKKILEKFDFKYTLHAPDVINLRRVTNPRHKKVFEATIHFAGEIGAEVIVYHAGKTHEDLDFSDKAQRSAEIKSLRNLGSIAEEYGVVIGVENLPHHSVEDVIKIVEDVNHPNVRMTLDVAHLLIGAKYRGWNYLEEVEKAMPFTVEVHISDTFGDAQEVYKDIPDFEGYRLMYGLGDLHMPLGYGDVPIKGVTRIIKKSGFSGIVILEINNLEKYYDEYKNSLTKLKELFYNGKNGNGNKKKQKEYNKKR